MTKVNQENPRRHFLKSALAATAAGALTGLTGAAKASQKSAPAQADKRSKAIHLANTNGEGRVVLITGTSSGFGRLMAITFARNGWETVATMRNLKKKNAVAAQELRDLAEKEKLKLHVVEIDVDKDKSVETGVACALRLTRNRLNVLVNNAGFGVAGSIEFQPIKVMHAMYQTNVFGSQRMIRAVLPTMRKQKCGLIVQITSGTGRVAVPGTGVYASSKWALEGLVTNLQYELAPLGIEVCIVEPGAYPTPFALKMEAKGRELLAQMQRSPVERARMPDYEDHLARYAANAQVISALNPQEIPDAVLQLAAMEPGSRPLRTVLSTEGEVQALNQINAVNEQIERAIVGFIGFGDWLELQSDCLVL